MPSHIIHFSWIALTVLVIEMVGLIEWLNFILLVLSSILFLFFYVKSAGPAALEQKIGPSAYPKCKQYRIVASVFELVVVINYIVYFFYPLPIGLPTFFTWDYWVSAALAISIAGPGAILMFIGLKEAGEERLEPKQEHEMYGGIYETMRHPQAVGEVTLWWLFAFLLNSPFLVIYSFVFIPIFYITCWAEERDLVIRYGQDYVDYQERVGFFPRLRKRE